MNEMETHPDGAHEQCTPGCTDSHLSDGAAPSPDQIARRAMQHLMEHGEHPESSPPERTDADEQLSEGYF